MSPHRMCCRHRNLSTHVPVWHLMSHQGLSSRSCPATTDVRGDEPTRCFARSTSPEYQSRSDRRQSHSILDEPPTTFVALVLAVVRPLLLCSDPMERNMLAEKRLVVFLMSFGAEMEHQAQMLHCCDRAVAESVHEGFSISSPAAISPCHAQPARYYRKPTRSWIGYPSSPVVC